MGFIPGMGVTLSSNVSAALESRSRPRRLRVMSAAESANNSSVISCTVPFLFVGLPITGTELLLDNWLLIHKAANISAAVIYDPVTISGLGSWPMWQVMLTSLAVISILCFFLTSRFIGFYLSMRCIPAHWFGWIVKLLILFFIGMLIANSDLTAGSTVFTLIFFTAIGVWAHRGNHDIIALPISLMIGSFAISKFAIAFQLWS
jgi:TctA family transporter